MVSQLLKDGLMEAVDIRQSESFDAGVLLPAPRVLFHS